MKRFASVLSLVFLAAAAHACPGCSDAVASSEPNYAKGVFWGIVFFLTVPALLVGGIALAILRARRAANSKRGVVLGQTPDPIR